jgi:hypothetical protein
MKLQSLKKNNNKKEGGGILDYRDEEVNIKFSGQHKECLSIVFYFYFFINILKYIFYIF